jgi:hypothetical protein
MAPVGQVPNKNLDERTLEELDLQVSLRQVEYRCPFVMQDYWQNKRPPGGARRLYWCSLDLEKFYPSLKAALIRQNIVDQLPPEWKHEAGRLLDSMLHFEIDPAPLGPDARAKMDLRQNQKTFSHIPTGLYVAGFLANAGLLSVDLEVARQLPDRAVAHFRFVDDHIVLAYSMDDLTDWMGEYSELLRTLHTGARINRDKLEPKELGRLIIYAKGKRTEKTFQTLQKQADAACSLDPQFPSPLMTKTLALVSAIARTDFNLLELSELAALTNQLEHLVLVDIPEEEIPQKTRLSFAATRLTRLVECRLATSTPPAELRIHQDRLQTELPLKEPENAKHRGFDEDVAQLIRSEVERVFQLFRKVLRERFDSLRLWTRAIQMCRSTGVDGLLDLSSDIDHIRRGDSVQEGNPLAADYLRANALSMLGTEALIAARTLQDEEAAHWRKFAARGFLGNLKSIGSKLQPGENDPWFVQTSWLQYCSGLYCSDLLLKSTSMSTRVAPGISFREYELAVGRRCVGEGSAEHGPAEWAWWAVRMNLARDPKPRQEGLAKILGKGLVSSREAIAFWRFFPPDVPVSTLQSMLQGSDKVSNLTNFAGWWYDALRERPKDMRSFASAEAEALPLSVRRLLEPTSEAQASLYDWTAFLRKLSEQHGNDPRCGEWTALDVVRQVAELVTEEQVFGLEYIQAANTSTTNLPYIHPANFRIPREWLQEKEPAWEQWQRIVKNGLVYVAGAERVQDLRYTPLINNGLFSELNIARGLGLLLYGLLRKGFDLPAIWNGPGHADVLKKMPRLLLAEMTCSTWTLGILASCLWPRVTENLIQQRYPLDGYKSDEDMLRDPILFLNGRDVGRAIEIAQKNLRHYQLSTMDDRARQLTPVSIRQLTKPDWRKVFEMPEEGGDFVHA